MKKTHNLFLLILSVFAVPFSLEAQLIITEVMYNLEGADKDREWIEVYNAGNTSVTIHDWRINDGANHIFKEPPENGGQGSLEIVAGEVFILADNASVFLSENTTNVTVVDTVLSLGQQEGSYTLLLLNDAGAVVDEVTYQTELGANGDGNSLHREGESLVTRAPSPGVYGNPTNNTQDKEGGRDANKEVVGGDEGVSGGVVEPEGSISAEIRTRDVAVVGAPKKFEAEGFGLEGFPLENARYIWNFGDGTKKEGKQVFHTYYHPSEYSVVLTVSSGRYSASDRTRLRVIPTEIEITSLGSRDDPYIELHNPSSYELNISGWVLQSERGYFILPENTFILPSSAIIFPHEVTGLKYPNAIRNVFLLYPNSAVAYRYGEDIAPYTPPEKVVLAPTEEAPQVKTFLPKQEEEGRGEEEFHKNEQLAALGEVVPLSENDSEERSSLLLWISLTLGLIFISIFAVFALKSTRNPADEFAIIEEKMDDES